MQRSDIYHFSLNGARGIACDVTILLAVHTREESLHSLYATRVLHERLRARAAAVSSVRRLEDAQFLLSHVFEVSVVVWIVEKCIPRTALGVVCKLKTHSAISACALPF